MATIRDFCDRVFDRRVCVMPCRYLRTSIEGCKSPSAFCCDINAAGRCHPGRYRDGPTASIIPDNRPLREGRRGVVTRDRTAVAWGGVMLAPAINRYIELHHAMGFKFHAQSGLLRSFAAFADARQDGFTRTQSVIDWAGHAPSGAQRRNRLLTVRRFALAMQAEDPHHECPPGDVFVDSVNQNVRFTDNHLGRSAR
jgi:hypothetical protein